MRIPTRGLAVAAVTVSMFVAAALAGAATTAKPSITSFSPASGKAGTKVTVTGKNLKGTTRVTIDRLGASFKVVSATKITATVPSGAKSGRVRVTTKGGTATSAKSFLIAAVYAANGSGTLSTTTTNVANGSTGNTVAFTYTAAAGGIGGGTVAIAVPSGWTAPVTTSAAGCTTTSAGTLATSAQTITVSGLTLAANGTLTITYGATSGGACASGDGATAATTGGSATWQAQEVSTAAGTLTNLGASPAVNVYAANGSGTAAFPSSSVTVGPGESGDILAVTYTAAAGGVANGTVSLAVPAGFSPPVTTNTAGCTTVSAGTLTTSGQTITVSALTLAANATLTITYGAISGGSCTASDGVTASSTAGTYPFTVSAAATSTGTLTAIATSPTVTVS